MKGILCGILSSALAASCIGAHASEEKKVSVRPTAEQIERIREALPPLSFKAGREWTRDESRFLAYYKLNPAHVMHHFGAVSVDSRRIAVHVFVPPRVRGSALLIHGYYDHAGVMNHLVHDLLKRRYAVVVYDQPGHGLSDGARASIGDFSEYVAVLRSMAALTREDLPGPGHLVAHSMGCAITIDYLLTGTDIDFRRVVLMAPLIHSAHWNLSGFGNRVAGKRIKTLPRVFRKNSSDPEFLAFAREDPLQTHEVPLGWVRALKAWNGRFDVYPASTRELLVVQGDRDTTVDWGYNTRALGVKFPRTTIHMVKGAGHQLMNESPRLRAQVFERVGRHLESEP